MTQTTGCLSIVGIGPGNDEHITPAALKAIKEADDVIGYTTYIALVRHHLSGKQVTRTGMTEEITRARAAVEAAASGRKVTLISSGDSGVYGMAGLVFEVLRERGWKRGDAPEVKLVPGITAANSCASLVGAPLIHDTCRISLSDLLTPWPVIEKRIECAAQGDFVICLYNPASGRRQRQIVEASRIIREHRPGTTPVALIKSAYRRQQDVVISDLDHFLDFEIGMNTTVLIGSSNTFVFEGYMVTPRGHSNKYNIEDGTVLDGQRRARSLVCDGDLASKSNGTPAPQLKITKIDGVFLKPSTEIYGDLSEDDAVEQDLQPALLPALLNEVETADEDSSVQNALSALALLNRAKSTPAPTAQSKSAGLGLIGRMGGGIIFRSEGRYFQIGELKEPCSYLEHGFEDPTAPADEFRELKIADAGRASRLNWEVAVDCSGEAGARELYRKLVILRNSSPSERLLRLVRDVSGVIDVEGKSLVDARWLSQTPQPIWEIVRDQILKCS